MNISVGANFRARLQHWFPDREFFMRSQGHVRFIKVSSRVQIAGAGAVAAALILWAVSMSAVAISQFVARHDRNSLLMREAKVEKAENRVNAYRKNLGQVADDLARRQDFLDKVTSGIEGLPKTIPQPAANDVKDTVSDSSTEAAKTVREVSEAIPEATGLARMEARQLAYAERLTRWADHRAAGAAKALEKLGLNPDRMLASSEDAQGGPLELLTTGRDGSIDPRFERLGLSVARMEALENTLDTIPQYLPADREDGTLLRARATPDGISGYLAGKLVTSSLSVLVYLAMIGVPGAFLTGGLHLADISWGRLGWVLILGMTGTQLLGATLGALVPSPRSAGYVSLPLLGLTAVSGIFYPITAMPGWAQQTAQAFPVYWLGLGMRSALLPADAASVEIGGSWRTPQTAAVLAAWALAGLIIAPLVLKRMARRQSGSRVARRRERAVHRAG